MRRQSWSFVFIVFKTITVFFAFQRQSSSLACRDNYGHLPFFEDFNVFRPRLLQSSLPSRDNQVRWPVKTIMVICLFSKSLMSFDQDYYNLLCLPETIKFVGMQRQSWSSAFVFFKIINVFFASQRQSSLLACADDHGHPLSLFS